MPRGRRSQSTDAHASRAPATDAAGALDAALGGKRVAGKGEKAKRPATPRKRRAAVAADAGDGVDVVEPTPRRRRKNEPLPDVQPAQAKVPAQGNVSMAESKTPLAPPLPQVVKDTAPKAQSVQPSAYSATPPPTTMSEVEQSSATIESGKATQAGGYAASLNVGAVKEVRTEELPLLSSALPQSATGGTTLTQASRYADESASEARGKRESQHKAQVEAKSEAKSEAQSEAKNESNAESKSENKHESKSEHHNDSDAHFEGPLPKRDRRILGSLLGLTTLWGVFGGGKASS